MSKRILIVDDYPHVRTLLRHTVGDHYNIVGEAVDGQEAIDKYKDLKPDLVILDLKMPKVNGLEALKKIIAFDPEVKIIVLTALGDQEFKNVALGAGAVDYVIKPFVEEELVARISKVFNRKGVLSDKEG